MQLLADYFPLILFFIAYKWQGIYAATAVAIAASIAQIAYFALKRPEFADGFRRYLDTLDKPIGTTTR